MTYLGVGMLLAALVLLFVFRANKGQSHPAVSGALISAVFPTLVLALIAFGTAILLWRMLS